MRLYRHRRKQQADAELNITAFMNLMVVLVPFLLITAVFSQISIIELQLPGKQSNTALPPKGLGLEIHIFNSGNVQVHTRTNGTIATFEASSTITSQLSSLLQKLKDQVPSETAVTLLIEDAVPYENIIQFMDAVRLVPKRVNGQMIKLALFPDVAIGSLLTPADDKTSQHVTQTLPRSEVPG